MSARKPRKVRRAGLRVFKALPPGLSHRLVRAAKPTYALGAIALIEWDGKVLALRQSHRRGHSLPGGLVDRGEQPADAVRREVLEETGLVIDPGDIVTVVFDPRIRHADVIFRVICDDEPQVRPAGEAFAHHWLDLSGWTDGDRATARILRALRAAHATPRPGRLLSGG